MRTPWTVYQLQKLRELYPNTPAPQLTEIVGHCTHSIYSKASRLGIKANLLTRRLKYWSDEEEKRVESLPDIEKAYIAGIIDGEGTIGSFQYKGRQGIVCCLSIPNTHKELLDWIASQIPSTKVVPKKVATTNSQPIWEFRLYGIVKVRKLIKLLLPYMIVKRQDAEKVLQYHSKYTPAESGVNIPSAHTLIHP